MPELIFGAESCLSQFIKQPDSKTAVWKNCQRHFFGWNLPDNFTSFPIQHLKHGRAIVQINLKANVAANSAGGCPPTGYSKCSLPVTPFGVRR